VSYSKRHNLQSKLVNVPPRLGKERQHHLQTMAEGPLSWLAPRPATAKAADALPISWRLVPDVPRAAVAAGAAAPPALCGEAAAMEHRCVEDPWPTGKLAEPGEGGFTGERGAKLVLVATEQRNAAAITT